MKALVNVHCVKQEIKDFFSPSLWNGFARIKNNWLTCNKHLPPLLAEITVPPAQRFHHIRIFHPSCRRDFTEVMQRCWQLSCLPWGYDWRGKKGENNWEKKTCLLSHCVIICKCGVVRKARRTWEMGREKKYSDHGGVMHRTASIMGCYFPLLMQNDSTLFTCLLFVLSSPKYIYKTILVDLPKTFLTHILNLIVIINVGLNL